MTLFWVHSYIFFPLSPNTGNAEKSKLDGGAALEVNCQINSPVALLAFICDEVVCVQRKFCQIKETFF